MTRTTKVGGISEPNVDFGLEDAGSFAVAAASFITAGTLAAATRSDSAHDILLTGRLKRGPNLE